MLCLTETEWEWGAYDGYSIFYVYVDTLCSASGLIILNHTGE
jgi:hypothetical protein